MLVAGSQSQREHWNQFEAVSCSPPEQRFIHCVMIDVRTVGRWLSISPEYLSSRLRKKALDGPDLGFVQNDARGQRGARPAGGHCALGSYARGGGRERRST